MPPERKPTCPKCGSTDVREWDLVPVPYELTGISPDGTIEIAPDNCLNPAWDGGNFDELRCSACEHTSSNPLDFYPWQSTQERAEALLGCVIRSLDGLEGEVIRAAAEGHSDRWWVFVEPPRGQRWRAQPHEVQIVRAAVVA